MKEDHISLRKLLLLTTIVLNEGITDCVLQCISLLVLLSYVVSRALVLNLSNATTL